MTRQEIRERLDRMPFEPFRIRLSDNRSYDIRHPNWNILGESVFVVGIPAEDEPNLKVPDHAVMVPLKLIVGIDPLPQEGPVTSR